MPVVAAAGGILGAAFVYLGYVFLSHEAVLAQAWPVACAVDIAAGFYVLRLVFRRDGAASFLLVIGIVTNAVGLVVLAAWPAFTADHLSGGLLIAAAVALAALLRRSGVHAFWPYIGICGTVSGFGFYSAGMHPALALVPVVPFLPREQRSLDLFADPADDDAVHHAEHEWNLIVHLALFLFGLVNAGVVVRGYDTGTWAVLAAALIGRPAGILLATGAAIAAGLQLPRRVGWRELIVISLATSSGFTFALFAATSLLPIGAVLTQVKVGALLTALGALTTYAAARALHVGRFAPHHVSGASDRGHAPRTRRRGAALPHPGVLPG
jgi:NhaA family Na+:H+ antiporter